MLALREIFSNFFRDPGYLSDLEKSRREYNELLWEMQGLIDNFLRNLAVYECAITHRTDEKMKNLIRDIRENERNLQAARKRVMAEIRARRTTAPIDIGRIEV